MSIERQRENPLNNPQERGELHDPSDCEIQLIRVTENDQTIKSLADDEKLILCKYLSLRTRLKGNKIGRRDYDTELASLTDENKKIFEKESIIEVLRDISAKTQVLKGYKIR